MGVVELTGLVFYGYHGALPEEQTLGQRFVVDVWLSLDVSAAAAGDDLAQTVDYGRVVATVREVVEGHPVRLIETLAARIGDRILGDYPRVGEVRVRVSKPSAPIASASTGVVAVETVRQRLDDAVDDQTAHHRKGTPLAAPVIPSVAADVLPGVLSAASIRALLAADPPLVEPLADPGAQIQPNGVDLTLDGLWRLDGPGTIGLDNAERRLPERSDVPRDEDGRYALAPGPYLVRFRETVSLPVDIMALGRPRSSLARCGAALHTAVWDAGYRGRSEALLVVYNSSGLYLRPGARILQLIFLRLDRPTERYSGYYQGENLGGA